MCTKEHCGGMTCVHKCTLQAHGVNFLESMQISKNGMSYGFSLLGPNHRVTGSDGCTGCAELRADTVKVHGAQTTSRTSVKFSSTNRTVGWALGRDSSIL